ncbi:pseudouridine synthase [Chitinimonas sp. BJYL2]|uniref:pseudouridine synthase n=1 Tax=Chitinimonas sp. BJYL2 TaxID=2976696 RepID=UPI0022B4B40C|nr:pseudouridine synthase [Chitinimonas sp. BJYL2]
MASSPPRKTTPRPAVRKPVIRDERAPGARQTTESRKPAERRSADGKPVEHKPTARKPAARKPAESKAGEHRVFERKPVDRTRVEGEAAPRGQRRPPVDISSLPVEPAKKMRQRHGSEKHQKVAEELRNKRVEARHVGDLRIQKALALSGVGSRRDCDLWVSEGRVSINGQVCQPGARVAMGDRVLVDGKQITIKWPDRLPRIVLYHKQEGELVSRDDPAGRTTVFERLPKIQSSAWVAVGRLDFNTSGLLIFTTSGDLANRLMHPRFEVQREYAVRVHGQLTDEQKKQLTTGLELEDGLAKFDMLEDQGGEGTNHWYRVILKEGRNREVRRMFEHFELTVSRLMRVRFGMLTLPSRLKRGQYYELEEPEVLAVLKWAGLGLTGRTNER